MASALFRLIASLGRNLIVSNTFGSFALLTVLVLGGFIIARGWIRVTNVFSMHFIRKLTDIHNFPSFVFRKHSSLVDLGLLDLSNDVCTKCYRC